MYNTDREQDGNLDVYPIEEQTNFEHPRKI